MSYEGYVQCVCKNGHFFSHPETYGGNSEVGCPTCDANPAFNNSVDETNGESTGYIPPELFAKKFLITAEVSEVCNLGHSHITSPAIYRIPTNDEAKELRHYFDDTDMEYHLLSKYQDRHL